MGDLLADLLNDTLESIPTMGVVNGVMDYRIPDDEHDQCSDSDPESDTEQREYVRRELSSYFPKPQEIGGLTDIEDGHEESILGTDILEGLHVPKVFDIYKFDAYYKKELPIDSFRTKILDMINTNSVVIIHGPTGCGKTTQVPQYILDQCRQNKAPCNIVCTQPRRIAAINIAQRVCEERGWAIGTVCGYQVGLDKNVGEDVILTYMTTEVLLQKLITEKNLNKYTHVIIDEVHERTKTLDFLLLIVRKYLFTNSPAVKVVLMSATMESEEFAYYFRSIPRNDPSQHLLAPVLHVDKSTGYITNIYYTEHCTSSEISALYNIDEPCISYQQYEFALKLIQLFDNLDDKENGVVTKRGSVLVFLPGFHEIEEMHRILMDNQKENDLWDIIPLHSSLSSDHMVKVFQRPKPGSRKLILSTNIAESSVTVPDVKYVIDFCLTKVMCVNEVTKFSSLALQWASHNNCMQRAGRVGRVSDGRVYRLVPMDFFKYQMQPNSVPEMQRAPLEHVILYMKLLELNDTPKNVLALAISPPNLKDVETCIWRLKEVGALFKTCRGNVIAADGDLTFLGRVMGALPIDIALSKMILLGHLFSCLDETVIMAAGCMTRNLFVQHFHDRFLSYRKKLVWADGSKSDFIMLLNLYNVWLNKKRQNEFRSTNDEYTWCKTNFVNLKGIREWDLLIKEIHQRLQRFGIEKPMGASRVKLSPVEKPTVLKVIICGAFYPNYFIRSQDYGQIDPKEAVKTLNGRDPFSTVYFSNMKNNQPGQIYVRQIKKLIGAENNPHVQIGFDGQSTKIFVEYKQVVQPEAITVDGRSYVTTMPGSRISVDVYEAVRKRQLRMPFRLRILPDHKAWAFIDRTEEAKKKKKQTEEELNCYTEVHYSPFPSLDIEYISVIITHIVDAGQFYCQNWNDETRLLIDKIFTYLNGPGIFLDPSEKVDVGDKIYAARFNEDSKFYRCKVLNIKPGKPDVAHVQFIDYGNIQRAPVNLICELPSNAPECHVQPIAMCCVLSGVQPDLVANPTGIWSEKVNGIFKRKTERVLLNAKVFSVVDNIVHLELYPQNPGRNSISFNKFLIREGLASPMEESERSKMDNELRQRVQNSEDPSNMSNLCGKMCTAKNYTDFDEPEMRGAIDIIELKGPYSPLEMKVCGLVQASAGANIRVEGDSVNAVLLDDNPEDPHSRLLVAAHAGQSSVGKSICLSQTTIMPSIPGLPMLMALLFCPTYDPKLTADGTRVASILCGLGHKEYNSEKANFPVNDISLVLDTELTDDIIIKVNIVRDHLNEGIKILHGNYDEYKIPKSLEPTLHKLKDDLFSLLFMKQKSVDRINVKYADSWKKNMYEEAVILKADKDNVEEDIWEFLIFIKLNDDRQEKMTISKNLDELSQIAKRLAPEREIACELCQSVVLKTIGDVRIHLFKDEHKRNLQKYSHQNKRREAD